ncbi:hypothetical protein NDU88_000207 [Pleurodeles waltl]|uniref:Uncharacterized protein n=1 Tax=Pleurodeles waltl TaxID=8319 RepID=A0AAV7PZJ5_PLEWA|nr:hypothetical protein NDU88_000207 [Pleurodeles waltl]
MAEKRASPQPPVREKVPGVAACNTHSLPHLQLQAVPRCHHLCPAIVTNFSLQPPTRWVGPNAKSRGRPPHVAPQPPWIRATSTSPVASVAPELVGSRGSNSLRLWLYLALHHQHFPCRLRGFLVVSLPVARQQGGKAGIRTPLGAAIRCVRGCGRHRLPPVCHTCSSTQRSVA